MVSMVCAMTSVRDSLRDEGRRCLGLAESRENCSLLTRLKGMAVLSLRPAIPCRLDTAPVDTMIHGLD